MNDDWKGEHFIRSKRLKKDELTALKGFFARERSKAAGKPATHRPNFNTPARFTFTSEADRDVSTLPLNLPMGRKTPPTRD